MEKDRALPFGGTVLLLALTAGLLLFRLGDVPLIGPDEPRYARVAVEMQRAGEWVTPTLQGEPWLEKPALYYWLAGICFAAIGESEAAARLPSAAAVLLMVALTAWVGTRLYGRFVGLSAGFACGTSVLAFVYGRAAAMDGLLAGTVSLAIGLIALRAVGDAGPIAALAAWAAIGLAALAKGPIGVAIPILVIGAWLLAVRERGQLGRVVSPGAIAALLLVAGPWYLAILRDQGWEFVDVFLLNHNLLRFASTAHSHPGPPWYYVGVLVLGLLPWTALALPGFGALSPRRSRADLFVLVWFLVPFLLFSAAGSKLPGYIVPCLPPLALIVGRGAAALVDPEARLPRGLGPRATALVGLVLAAALLGLALKLVLVSSPGRLHLFPSYVYGTRDVLGALPAAVWAALISFVASRKLIGQPLAALTLLRIGAAGFLLLLTLALPPILGRFQSGRAYFLPANGREVVAWGAWRTAWMAGYFYNDGRVRKVDYYWELREALETGVGLVLCGPAECRQLAQRPELVTLRLAEGPRENALLKVELRPSPPPLKAASPS